MGLSLLLILVSFVLLAIGAELLVRGAASLGLRAGLSSLVVGLTVVAFGTSAPELAVSVKAAMDGAGDIAIGNVVGSNLFNVAVILGFSALVRPLAVHAQVIRFDMPLMLVASIAFGVMFMQGEGLARWEGGLLFAGIIAYTVHSVRQSQRQPALVAEASEVLAVPNKPDSLWLSIVMIAGGLVLLVFGARLLVQHAVELARALHVSEAVIGLTIIAAGTSLPELATSVVASVRRQTDIAIGNIVGSNLFNLLCIAGVAGLISPIPREGIRMADLIWMIAVSALLLPLLRTGFKLRRWEGLVLVAAYVIYLALLLPKPSAAF